MSRTEPLDAYEAKILCARIAALVGERQFEFSKHAVDQTILRQITTEEIRQVLSDPEVWRTIPQTNTGPAVWSWGSRKQVGHCTFIARIRPEIL